MTKARLFAAVLAFSMLLGATGCGSGGSPSSSSGNNKGASSGGSSDGPVKIQVRGLPKENDAGGLENIERRTALMKEKYPEIELEYVDWSYDVNTFLPKAASGQLPTLYNTYFTEANKIISQGFSRDITEETKAWGYDQALNPSMLNLISRDGKIYGLPSGGYALGMWYSVPLFEQAGLVNEDGSLKMPTNSDELIETAVAIKEKTGQAGYFFPTMNNQGGWYFSQLAWTFGAEFEEEGTDGSYKAVFNSSETVEALQWLKDMRWKYDVVQPNVLVTIDEMHKLFAVDQCGTCIGELGQINGSITNYNGSAAAFAMGPIVKGANSKGRSTALLGGTFECIAPSATAEQVDAVFKFLEVAEGYSPKLTDDILQAKEDTWKVDAENGKLVGPQGIRVWTDQARMDAEDERAMKHANVDMKFFDPFTTTLNDGSIPLHPEHPVYCQELYKILDTCVQAVLTDENADPQKLLDTAAADFQRDYLDKYNAGEEAN